MPALCLAGWQLRTHIPDVDGNKIPF